jgi:hypothetical protein
MNLKFASKHQKTLNKPPLQFSSPKNVVKSEKKHKFEEYFLKINKKSENSLKSHR